MENEIIVYRDAYPYMFNAGSVMAVYLEMFGSLDAEMPLSHGTGFVVNTSKWIGEIRVFRYFLVTARHNFTGKNHFSGEYLSLENSFSPNFVKVFCLILKKCNGIL